MSEHPAVVFLEAAWARAEETARATGGGEIEAVDYLWGTKYLNVRQPDGEVRNTTEFSSDLADHFALHSPAAVLRRVGADRQIIGLHQAIACGEFGCDCHQCCAACRWTEDDEAGREPVWGDVTRHVYPCRTVLLLAQAWGWKEDAS